MVLDILIGLAALGLGLYLGRPRRYQRDTAEIEKALEGEGERQWTQRHFTPLDLLKRDRRGSHRPRGTFRVTHPGDDPGDEEEGPPQVRLRR